MLAPALEFDAPTHRYRYGGLPVPGVTWALEPLYDFAKVPPSILEHACMRGRLTHEASVLFDEGDLDMESLDPELLPYIEAWSRCRQDTDAEILETETPRYSPLGFAGTPDRIVRWRGARWVWDLKTVSVICPVDALQTAGYQKLTDVGRRATIQLKPDGTYRLQEWKDKTDWSAFYAALQLHHWKLRNLH